MLLLFWVSQLWGFKGLEQALFGTFRVPNKLGTQASLFHILSYTHYLSIEYLMGRYHLLQVLISRLSKALLKHFP
jgi:hypothetical protein